MHFLGLQNLLRTNAYMSNPQQKQLSQTTIIDESTINRGDAKLKQNNDGSGTNHNTNLSSLPQEPQQQQQVNIIHGNLPQQFAIIGSTTGPGPGGQNRIFLTSTPHQQVSSQPGGEFFLSFFFLYF